MATLLTPRGRVSFPNVYVPTAMEEGKPKKYSVTLLFWPANMDDGQKALLVKMKEEAQKVAMERFGCRLGEKPGGKGKPLASPFHKGSEKPDYYDDDCYFVKFSSRRRPAVVNGQKDDIPEDSADFYAGCWAHLSYTVYAYDVSGNRGVAFGLRNIQKTQDDEAFDGSTTADEDFDVVSEGKVTDDDDLNF